ncbi:hypothetical protein [Sediminicurvatus halobius]|uniref:Uncharacterized protein n=1 Tax=Sediminicurvatus halobius TaxID=2182432 RepID=A0A2U2MXM5_9GAMM|nr:hypothetical protein [Spiribacter halobius]PWG61725.1 hypothetical protein DEM34_14760 [Spiribacter halobius]UEX76848.1 hypothetical protein LMH63_12870 [Spiribacter halobius]
MSIDSDLARSTEARHGADVATLVRRCIADGLSQSQACGRLGVPRGTVGRWAKMLGIRWVPRRDLQVAALRRQSARNTYRWVEIDGERITIGELHRRTGIALTTLRMRYDAGLRGRALTRRPGRQGKAPAHYHLGIGERDWRIILEHAEQHGPKTTANRLGIPLGAIQAMRRGDVWRVA